ncbi:MAG: hypothetical protein U1F68_20950, partial [Gammaproteobacteria bacterium]
MFVASQKGGPGKSTTARALLDQHHGVVIATPALKGITYTLQRSGASAGGLPENRAPAGGTHELLVHPLDRCRFTMTRVAVHADGDSIDEEVPMELLYCRCG